MQLSFNVICGLFQQGKGDGAFFAGLEHTGQEFATVEALAHPVFLDDDHGQHLHGFIGRESAVTLQTLPAAADAGAVVGGARVNDLAVKGGTEWALHRAVTSSNH